MINSLKGVRAYQAIDQINNVRPRGNGGENGGEQIFVPTTPPQDKLEISQQAVELNSNTGEAQNLQRIQQQIDSGFYDRPEVLRTVARKINDDIASQG